jgi:hypothetical protein
MATGSLSLLHLGTGYQALYEVLRFEATLELLDDRGEAASYESLQVCNLPAWLSERRSARREQFW